jgi:hypothetical protein
MMAQFSVGLNPNEPDPNDPMAASRPHPITPAGVGEPAEVPASATTEPDAGSGATRPTDAAAPATTPAPTPPAAQTPAVQKDVLSITTARHRLNKDLTLTGTSTVAGTIPSGSASVTLYDVSSGRAASRLGTTTINSLGIWSLTAKPGPAQQVISVKAESNSGGTVTGRVDTR